MTAAQPAGEAPQPAAASADQEPAQPAEEQPEPQEAPPEQPQNAWEAAQELLEHAPESFTGQGYFFTGGTPHFGGGLVGGDQHTVSGGQVHGDVVTGQKTTIYQIGARIGAAFGTPLHGSGEVPAPELDALESVFQDGPAFPAALDMLREARVLVLAGRSDSGRRSAALMLLHRLGARRIRSLDPDVSPSSLLTGVERADGYLLADYTTPRSRPFRPHHLLRLREYLDREKSYLVITVARSASFRELAPLDWEPPAPEDVLAAHLRGLLAGAPAERITGLLSLPPVLEFLAKTRPIRELAEFAAPLAGCATEADDQPGLAEFGQGVVQEQVGRWFGDPDLPLREKAFLLSLAVFDHAPYALTAELSDQLFRRLEAIDAPGRKEGIPPFGNSIEERLALARAELTEENEQTPWGPVPQRMASFADHRTSHTLLRETWISHPSARPAILGWLNALATDPRPLVRTRVASAAALLASVDLSSAMGRLLGPWSESKDFRLCLQAANTLALAYYAGTAAVPRILHDWCQDDNARRRWSAIRGYALLGHLLPAQALEAFALAADRLTEDELTELAEEVKLGDRPQPSEHPTGYQALGLVEAAELLILSPAGPEALAALVRWLSGPPQLRQLALAVFLTAAQRTEGEQDPAGRPLLLGWYAESHRPEPGEAVEVTTLPGQDGPAAVRTLLTVLWRTALADRSYGPAALRVLRGWLFSALPLPEVEAELADLLAALTVTDRDRLRLSHLLRTTRDGLGTDGTGAVDRLLLNLSPH
ncbi:hypothetical protein [Kitasatospora sp. NPDC088351]|uniref:hypothetical protein n=1 Tax=Kitasatospora sp. NPDC088351 TaxID=3155180 RepID=UPI00341DD379